MAKSNERKGMRYPPLNDVIKRAHNKYELVIATSTRAREIVDGKDPLIPVSINNPISIATEEIYEDKIKLVNPVFDGEPEEKTEAPQATEETETEQAQPEENNEEAPVETVEEEVSSEDLFS